jgi:hypothetical protein
VCSVPVCWAWPDNRTPAMGGRVGVTFKPCQVLPWAWQVKGEGMSVNEAVYTGVIESTVGWRR